MTETNQQQRDRIAAKVRALLTKTVENGCTEAEAMAATAAAQRLMEEYDLTFKDVEEEVKADRYGVRRLSIQSNPYGDRIAVAVCAYFGCRVWGDRDGKSYCVFGSQTDTQMAVQMISLLSLAIMGEAERYMRSPGRDRGVHGRSAKASFLAGISRRLNERLREMKADRDAADRTSRSGSTALVVIRQQVVDDKFRTYCRDNGLRLGSGGTRRRTVGSNSAYEAGKAAGSRVDLGGSKIGGGGNARIGR